MKTYSNPVRTAVSTLALSLLVGSATIFAQDQAPAPPPDDQQQNAPANGEWRKVGDPPPGAPVEAAPPADSGPQTTMDPNYSQQQGPPPPPDGNQQNRGRRYPGQYPHPSNGYPQAGYYDRGPVPAKLTIKPGTFITVRLNQGLSSDRNQVGDGFAATLAKPMVVDGVVVADRGQTVGGKVVEAKKAGRVEGTSRLAVQLTDLTLLDGQPLPIQTQLFSRNGPTSVGRDVGAVGATTATGAAIGAAAGWGTGAAIGAGAGALAGIVGVLVTRGHPTYLYPEQILTFRVEAPATLSTEAAPQAFRWVGPGDYERPYDVQNRTPGPAYRYGSPYPYAYDYPYWGSGVGVYWGPSLYWGRGWGRGYWGRGWGWRR